VEKGDCGGEATKKSGRRASRPEVSAMQRGGKKRNEERGESRKEKKSLWVVVAKNGKNLLV
jgi:hypothetical protein